MMDDPFGQAVFHKNLPHTYFVAGVKVSTNRLLDLPTRGSYKTETSVIFLPLTSRALDLAESFLTLSFSPFFTAYLREDGSLVIIEVHREHSDPAAPLRQVLPFAASLAGQIILHASALADSQGVMAFVGESGAGKSTLAQKLSERGFEVMADDLLPCQKVDGEIVLSRGEKENLKLNRIAFLERSDSRDFRLRPLRAKEAFVALLRHGFGEVAHREVWTRQFRFYRHLADYARAWILEIPEGLARLDEALAKWSQKETFPLHSPS